MSFEDSGLTLFGLQIIPAKKKVEELSGAISLPIDDEGGALINVGTGAAAYGVYLDQNAQLKNELQAITKYREIALYPEVDLALQDIINEAIPQEADSPQIEIILDDLDLSDELKDTIREEFKGILNKLDYANSSADLFRRWYIDGRMYLQIIVDKLNLNRGIVELRPLDAAKIRKVKEVKKERTAQGVDIIAGVNEYYIYNEQGFIAPNPNAASSANLVGVKISPDAIIYVPSGYYDQQNNLVLSYLNKVIRPANQLRMLEDASVVYFIARAPERRIFYIDVGNLPKLKAEQYLKDIMNKYRNKMVYDSATGSVSDSKKHLSLLEDFWLPRRDGSKGTSIETLPGAQGMQSMLDNINYFQKKMYQALNIPISRLSGDESTFGLGRSSEISRDELKFQKFINRLRLKYAQLFFDALKIQLTLKGICNTEEWEEFKEQIRFQFQSDNYFTELKESDVLTQRMMMLPQVDQYLGKYFSKEWVQKNVLRMSDDDIEIMDEQIAEEEGDPTAQPTIPGMPPGGDPSMMGGDPSMQDPNAPVDSSQQGADPNAQQFPFPQQQQTA